MKAQTIARTQSAADEISKEAMQILEILDQIESHTATLRAKLMEELKLNNQNIKIDLSKVEE